MSNKRRDIVVDKNFNSYEIKEKQRRPTDHPKTKNILINDKDLWAIAGHCLIHDQCKEILRNAYDGFGIPKGYRPIPIEYKRVKINGSSYRKSELLARILCLETTRIMCFNLLKTVKNSLIPEDSELKDYFLQFYENEEKFPGDIPESDELKRKCNVQIVRQQDERNIIIIEDEKERLISKINKELIKLKISELKEIYEGIK